MEFLLYNSSTNEIFVVDETDARICASIGAYHESVFDVPYHTVFIGVL